MSRIGQRRDADRPSRGPRPHRYARFRIGVGSGEKLSIAPVVLARQHDLPGARALWYTAVGSWRTELDAAPALKCIIPPRAVMHAVGHRLAELTVIRDVDAEFVLMPHDIGHRRFQRLLKRHLVSRLTCLACAVRLNQRIGPRQTADMARQDVILATPHSYRPPRLRCY